MGERNAAQAMDVLAEYAMRTYRTPEERAALRCALSDAASLCDTLTKDIAAENRGNHGRGATTKRGRELAAVAKRCGDTIWALRDKITVPRP